ncbi:hypothetical protein D3OALGB2SA_2500 [Olavius algarvensis associated proteobacterium Delta 3]|nr:hypothetical protein D3OALGB2SA_2500 [Olavius algarvensis associated proteobacterium Delta 3]
MKQGGAAFLVIGFFILAAFPAHAMNWESRIVVMDDSKFKVTQQSKKSRSPKVEIKETRVHCGRQFAELGDFKFEVMEKCGEPLFAEVIGYDNCRKGSSGRKIEQLVFGPMKGKYFVMTFVGGKLKKIESRIKR